MSVIKNLIHRSGSGRAQGIEEWAEKRLVHKFDKEYLEHFTIDECTCCAITAVFSPDGRTFATAHGDHTVKVFRFSDRKLLQCFRGHSRTPWTVKYHPFDNDIVASGCLGGEVRIWNIETGKCMRWMNVNEHIIRPIVMYNPQQSEHIISISFHPSGKLLAIGSKHAVHTWVYESSDIPHVVLSIAEPQQQIKCLCFPPLAGDSIILGLSRGRMDEPGQRTLLLVDFRLDAALKGEAWMDISRARVLLSRATFFNDCGIDVSPCGRYLATLGQLWIEDEDTTTTSRYPTAWPDVPNAWGGTTTHTHSAHTTRSTVPGETSTYRIDRPDDNDRNIEENSGEETPTDHVSEDHTASGASDHASKDHTGGGSSTSGGSTPRGLKRARPEHNQNWTSSHKAFDSAHDWGHYPGPFQLCGSTTTGIGHYEHRLVVIDMCLGRSNMEAKVVQSRKLTADVSASGVTSVRFSPTAKFLMLGCSINQRKGEISGELPAEKVIVSIHNTEDLSLASLIKSTDEDLNGAFFHPVSGMGFLYVAKQGTIRLMQAGGVE